MANLQFTRIKKIFPSREDAIKRLDELSRTYAESVAVMYYSPNKSEELILSIYKSEEKGDYYIIHDTYSAKNNGFRVFRVKKTSEDQSDSECINIALFGEDPKNYDMVNITSFDGGSVTSYIYYEGSWSILGIGTDTGISNLITTNTDTVRLTLEPAEVSNEKILKADVNLDNQSLIYDDNIKGIRVNKIYGGTY